MSFFVLGHAVNGLQSHFLQTVIDRGDLAIKSIHFRSIVNNMIIDVAHALNVKLKESKVEEKVSLLVSTISKRIIVEVSTQIGDAYAITKQPTMANNFTSTIQFQAAWIDRAIDSTVDLGEKHRHLALSVIKLLHELGHCFTREIMKFCFLFLPQKKLVNFNKLSPIKKEKKELATPQKCGTKQERDGKRLKTIGDMGFLLEEHLAGARFYGTHGKQWQLNTLVVECRPNETAGVARYDLADSYIQRVLPVLCENSTMDLSLLRIADNEKIAKPVLRKLKVKSDNKKRKFEESQSVDKRFPVCGARDMNSSDSDDDHLTRFSANYGTVSWSRGYGIKE